MSPDRHARADIENKSSQRAELAYLKKCHVRLTSSGNHHSRSPTAMPAATTGETAKQLDGHATVQIDCRLGAERPIAFPATQGRLVLIVSCHAFSLCPVRGVAYEERPLRRCHRWMNDFVGHPTAGPHYSWEETGDSGQDVIKTESKIARGQIRLVPGRL